MFLATVRIKAMARVRVMAKDMATVRVRLCSRPKFHDTVRIRISVTVI